MTADVQRELAEALAAHSGFLRKYEGGPNYAASETAAALLPTVQRLIADAEKRAAAAVVESAITEISRDRDNCPNNVRRQGYGGALYVLKSRAAALDPTP